MGLAYSTAIAAPSRALLRTSAMLAVRLAPSVISTIRPRRYGVASLPVMPSRSMSASAWSMIAPISSAGISSSAGIGLATTMPDRSPSDHAERITAATSAAESTRIGAAWPLEREKNDGNSSLPCTSTGTP